jgi:hypothetical protein
MPLQYTHHIGYTRTPIPGARPTGHLFDRLGRSRQGLSGSWSGSQPGHSELAPTASLAGILAVM